MKKEFLNLDEFMALLASHGYEWGDANTNSLLLGALDSEALTPVFFYGSIFDINYSNENLASMLCGSIDWDIVKSDQCTLKGYFSLPKIDAINFYENASNGFLDDFIAGNAPVELHRQNIEIYKTYGQAIGDIPSMKLHKAGVIKAQTFFISIEKYGMVFSDFLYPTEQVEKMLTPDDTATPAQLASLTHELNEAKAIIAQQKERIAELEQAQASQPNEELHPKTLKTVSHLLNVLFDKARFDIDAHMGTTNSQIVELSNKLNTPITKKPVSYWIKQVKQLRIDKNIG